MNWFYDYNALDQLTRETLHIDGRVYDFVHGYNANGQLASRSRAGGPAVNFAPDALGRATAVAVGAAYYVHSAVYHPNGLLASGYFGNGHVFGQTLNARQRPWTITTARSGGPVALSRTHTYNLRGQITSIVDNADPTGHRVFDYDLKGRLRTANGPWGNGSATYDALDNLRSQTGGAETLTTSYDAANRVTHVSAPGFLRSYGYDARGNATTVGALNFAYDFSNQPVSMSGAASASYVYDGNLKRVRSVSGGKVVYSIYSALGGSVLLRDEVTDGVATDYLALGPMALRLSNGANPQYIHADHLGSVVAGSDASGTVNGRQTYAPFGGPQLNVPGNANHPGFTGHVHDAASNLIYMQARYYDPQIGRFLSTDPVGYQDQLNLYAYVRNDPVNKVDPDGRWAEDLVLGLPSLAMGSASLVNNLRQGNFGAAAVDGLGMLADTAAIAMPGVPGGAGLAIAGVRATDSVATQGAGALKDGAALPTGKALDAAVEHLGKGHKEIAPGVFKSADGNRMVRMTDSDLAKKGNHAGAPHMNFETGRTVTKPNGKEQFISRDNKHIFLPEEK